MKCTVEKKRKKYDELRAQYQQWKKIGGQQQQDFDWQNWSAESGKGAHAQYANAEDLDSSLMRSLRRSRGIHSNPWTHFPRLITSVDFIKRDTPLRLFHEILPQQATYPRRFDILVLDEAHNVSPSGSGHYAIDSQRTQAIREIVPHFEHKLFLSATPHNGYSESFSALLELLDNQRFARGVAPDRKQLESVMVRRLKSDPEFVTWNGERRFPQRKLDVIEVPYSESRQANAKAMKNALRLSSF